MNPEHAIKLVGHSVLKDPLGNRAVLMMPYYDDAGFIVGADGVRMTVIKTTSIIKPFPKWQMLFPPEPKLTVSLYISDLLEVMVSLKSLTKCARFYIPGHIDAGNEPEPVKIEAMLNSTSRSITTYITCIEASGAAEGVGVHTALNPAYVIDMLKSMKRVVVDKRKGKSIYATQVSMHVGTPTNPVKFTCGIDDEYTEIIMPMYVQEWLNV